MARSEVFQYQARAEPVLTSDTIPSFGWNVQSPPPPLAVARTHAALVQAFASPHEPPVVIPPDIGWNVQEQDVIQPKTPIQLYEARAPPAGFLPIIPSFAWFVAPPDVIQPPHVVREGGAVGSPINPIPAADIRPFAVEGTLIYVVPDVLYQAFAKPILPPDVEVVPDFGWFVPPADVIRTAPRPTEGLAERLGGSFLQQMSCAHSRVRRRDRSRCSQSRSFLRLGGISKSQTSSGRSHQPLRAFTHVVIFRPFRRSSFQTLGGTLHPTMLYDRQRG